MIVVLRSDLARAKRDLGAAIEAVEAAQKGLASGAAKIFQGFIRDGLSGKYLNPRTGLLRRSWTERAIEAESTGGATAVAALGSDLPYSGIQDSGGEIRPTSARNLTIPVGPALTPKGVERDAAARMRANHEFDWAPVIHAAPNITGRLGLYKTGRDEAGKKVRKFVTWYLLARSMVVPESGYARKATEEAEPQVDSFVLAGIHRAIGLRTETA